MPGSTKVNHRRRELQVLRLHLQFLGSQSHELLADFATGVCRRGTGKGDAAAGRGAPAGVRCRMRVSMHDTYGLERYAELIRRDLSERRLVSLAPGVQPRANSATAIFAHFDDRALVRTVPAPGLL